MARTSRLLVAVSRRQGALVGTVRSLWPTLVAIVFVHLISPRAVSIPEPALIFTVPVVFAAVQGSRVLGLLAASIALADVGFSLYASGDPVGRFDQDAVVRGAVTAICFPAVVLIAGRFRDRMHQGDDLQKLYKREIAHKDGPGTPLGLNSAGRDRGMPAFRGRPDAGGERVASRPRRRCDPAS